MSNKDNFSMPSDLNDFPVQVLGFSGTADIQTISTGQSTVIDADTKSVVRISAIEEAWVLVGENPTAAEDTCVHYGVGVVEYVKVPANHKISTTAKINIVKAI